VITPQVDEEFIGTIDVWQLRQLRWPVLRMLARHYVEERELGRYVRDLLKSKRWNAVRVVPHPEPHGEHPHVFDLYGQRLY
jgi:hypothetical protein